MKTFRKKTKINYPKKTFRNKLTKNHKKAFYKTMIKNVISLVDNREIKKITKKINPDIVHGHELTEYGKLTADIGDYKKILTVWGSDVFRYPWESKTIFKKVKYSLENVDIIHVTHAYTKEFIIEKFGIDDKFKVIPWGIDLKIFNKKTRNELIKNKISKKLKIHDDDLVLIYPKGFRDKNKQNYITLLEAFSKLSSKNNKLKLILISYGFNSGIEEIEKIIKKNKLENRVYIEKDFISIEEIAQIYNMSDLCFVTEDTDQLSLAIIESMACECIPVLSDIPAYKTIFKEYENCLYINQKDVNSYINIIEKYKKENGKINKKIIKNNIKLAKNSFNRDVQMPKIMDMYQELLK
jgi:glycosyltransferase involved in cell wall biosynthesis